MNPGAWMLAAFAPCFCAALLLPEPEECYALAKKVGAQYYLTCNLAAECPNDPGVCNFKLMQVGAVFYHGCACDSGGGQHSKCDGYMQSGSSDPEDPGSDVFCFDEQDPCPSGKVCDEEQLGTQFERLCRCK